MARNVAFSLLATVCLHNVANAVPAPAPLPVPTPVAAPAPDPQLVSGLLGTVGGTVGGVVGAVGELSAGLLDNIDNTLSRLLNPQPTSTPKSTGDVLSYLHTRYKNKPSGIVNNALDYALNGLLQTTLGVQGLQGATIDTSPAGINSFTNVNPSPPTKIYPQKSPNDAPYSVPEPQLRAALFIPPTFNPHEAPNPVLLVPGTGSFGGNNYEGNFAKILARDPSIAQAVWLNIPGAMLYDVQQNAEFIAYAANYLCAVTNGSRVSVLAFSQGNLATQWALKYWPSMRKAVKQLVAVSPDFHGTTLANVIDVPSDLGVAPLPPAILQQEYDSAFVAALRADGGDSAYVPTTTFYSAIFDEIVQPQAGTGASAYMLDARGVGVSNNEIQGVCGVLTPAGALGTHESLLFNGFVVAVAVQALREGGPVERERMDLEKVCQNPVYPALDLVDVVETEGIIPVVGVNLLQVVAGGQGVVVEPELRAYARK